MQQKSHTEQDQGEEGDATVTLKIENFPAAVLDAIEQQADERRPSTKRNDLIRYALEELAAGRVIFTAEEAALVS